MSKEYIEHWTHFLNERGFVEIRFFIGDEEKGIELHPRDIKNFKTWLDIANAKK